MNQFNSLRFLIFVIGLFSIFTSNAQLQTARFTAIPNSNSKGFYEYLPVGYNPAASKTYTLLLFIHGAGECGNGVSELPLILRHGPPNMINWNITNPGTFPDSFVVSGVAHRFIVISPQFLSWPDAYNVNAIIDYCISHYKVNVNKIYLTGLSMGGGLAFQYVSIPAFASRVAAIGPMATTSPISEAGARVVATYNIPVWAFHNDSDLWVTSANTTYSISLINQPPAPIPAARKTIFHGTDHDCWYLPYLPSWGGENFNGVQLNFYQWLLTFTRQNGGIVLPVTLSEYKASLTGALQVTITWTTTQEVNNDHFTLERSTDGINYTTVAIISGTNTSSPRTYTFKDESPAAGDNFYRLSQTDVDGKIKYFDTLKVSIGVKRQQIFVVNPNPVRNKLTLELFHEERGLLQVILQDINGKILRNWKFEKSDDQWQQSLNIPELSRGMYIVTVIGKSIRESKKLIKE